MPPLRQTSEDLGIEAVKLFLKNAGIRTESLVLDDGSGLSRDDLITAEALKWIDEVKDRPFFLYYAVTLPHANNEGGKAGMEVPDLGQYAATDWPPQQRAHAEMISRLDADPAHRWLRACVREICAGERRKSIA